MVAKPVSGSVPIYATSVNGDIIVNQIQPETPWLIRLNSLIPEPIVSIEFTGSIKPVEVSALLDTGSSVCVITQRFLDILKPHDSPQPPNASCVGPDGSPLECSGRISLSFLMGTCTYRETFYILSTRTDVTIILGYPFMVNNHIKLVAGEYVSNNSAPVPVYSRSITKTNTPLGPLKIQPCQNYEMLPNSVRQISVQVVNASPEILDNYKYSQWSVQIPGQQTQIACMDSRFSFEIYYTNNSEVSLPAIMNDQNFGSAVPLVEFLNDRHKGEDTHTSARISVTDILKDNVSENANITLAEDGYDIEKGYTYPDIIKNDPNDDTLVTIGRGIEAYCLHEQPCSACISKGAVTYCLYEDQCKSIPHMNLFSPKIEVMKESIQHVQEDTQISIMWHTSQCIQDAFSRNYCRGAMISCDAIPHHWFLPAHGHINRNELVFRTVSPHKLGIVISHCRDRMRGHHFLEDTQLVENINTLLVSHGVKTIFFGCACMSHAVTLRQFKTQVAVLPGQTCPDLHGPCNLFKRRHICQVQNPTQQYVSSDKTSSSPDILTSDPTLIKAYLDIVKNNELLFSRHSWDIGLYRNPETNQPYVFSYRLKPGAVPFVAKFRPIAPMKRKPAQEMILNLLEHKIISRRICPWITNSVWVVKARPILSQEQARERGIPWQGQEDEKAPVSLRLTVSYVKLNAYLEFVPTPLPNIRKLFSEMRNSDTLTVLDLTWSYFSLKICPVSATMTGFWSGITSDISLAFNRSPMGIAPSSGFLQAAVTLALSSVKAHVINYSDNVLIHSPAEIHPEVVSKTFALLRGYGFKVKPNKVAIHIRQKVKVLGCVFNIATQTLHPDPAKVKALSEMPYPDSLTSLKRFLGSFQFLISTMHGSAQPLSILYQLTRGKSSDFHFGQKAKQAFDHLIQIALNPRNFIYFIDYSLTLILRCDSSTDAVGWTLLQYIPEQNRYISCGYGVKVFTPPQQRYGPSEREILGAVIALKAMESSISGADCIVQMDCRGIILLASNCDSSSKMQRYVSYLQSFSPPLRFQWVSGKDRYFAIADLLSRPNHPETPPLTNKRIKPEDEERVEKLAGNFPAGISTVDTFPIILDYVLTMVDKEQTCQGSIFISPSKHVCMHDIKDGPCVTILQRNQHRPVQQAIPLTEADDFLLEQEDEMGKEDILSQIPSECSIGAISAQPFDSPYQEVIGKDVSKGFLAQLDPLCKNDRFLQFIILKFPLLNMEKLIALQTTDTFCSEVIEKCGNTQNKEWVKKPTIIFKVVRGVLVRKHLCQVYGWSIQLCLPKVVLQDVLLSLHRSPISAHLGVKRLCDAFSKTFYNNHLREYAQLTIDNCFLCASNHNRIKASRGDYANRTVVNITGPGQFWFADIIQIVSKRTPGPSCILTFSDAYSNFVIPIPFAGEMTNERFLEYLEHRIVLLFPQTRFVLTDNASNISTGMVKQALRTLNIQLLNSRPYSAKSNAVEGMQRILLASIRLAAQQLSLPPEEWTRIVPAAAISLNCTPYQGLRFNISPHQIQFGLPPNLEAIFCVNPDILEESGYDTFVVQLAKARFANELVMCQYHKEKILRNEKTQKQNEQRVFPGDIVFRHSRTSARTSNYKLRPRNSKLYLVLFCTSTSAFCKQYTGGRIKDQLKTFQDFLDAPKNRANHPLETFETLHFDLTDLVPVKSLITVDQDTKKLTTHLEGVTFPGAFMFQADIQDEEMVELNYDIARDDDDDNNDEEETNNVPDSPSEPLEILNPNLPTRGVLRVGTKSQVRFSPYAEWWDDEGGHSRRPLSTKYTLKAPIFSSCI